MKTDKYNEVEVYKAYVEARGTKGYSVIKLCKKLGIPRPTLYTIVRRIEDGDEKQLQRCLSKSKWDCLWEFRYKRRFEIIDEKNGDDYSEQIKVLVKEMHKDGFGVREIARRLVKDPSTIMHHLKLKK